MTVNVANVGVGSALASPDGSVLVSGGNLEVGGAALLAKYGISGLTTQWNLASSVPSNGSVLTIPGHDFQPGHGIRVLNADNNVPAGGLTPAAPTVAPAALTGSTAYQYQVALIYNVSGGIEACSAASAATAIANGYATLSALNYNNVQFTPTTPGAYAVYGRASGAMAFLGIAWHIPPLSVNAVNAATVPPYLGGNLAALTTYQYDLTGVMANGDETSSLVSASVTTGAAVHPVDVTWNTPANGFIPYQFFNIYRNGFFIAQVPVTDLQWEDNGTVAPTAQALPTLDSFRDAGLTIPTAPVGVPVHVPATPPATAIHAARTSTVLSVTSTTITLSGSVGGAGCPSGSLVLHDDTPTIQAALNAEKIVTLPVRLNSAAKAYYNLTSALTVPAGGALNGQPGGWAEIVNVTASANTPPAGGLATLCFLTLLSGVNTGGDGAAVRNIQMFWPYQTNSVGSNGVMSIIPYPAGIASNHLTTLVENIVDCNSYIGIAIMAGGAKVERVEMAVIRWGIFCIGSEASIRHIRGNPAVVYGGNTDSPRLPDSTAVRGTGDLPIIEHVGVDRCIEIWWTNMLEGVTISNVWNDDTGGAAITIDTPVSPIYQSFGRQYQHRLSNLYFMAGGGGLTLSPAPNATGNAPAFTGGSVTVTNAYINWNVNILGPCDVSLNNVFVGGQVVANPPTLYSTPPLVRVFATGCQWGNNTARFTVENGNLKAYVSSCGAAGPRAIPDLIVSPGTLYVIDDDAMETTRLRIPTGTALTAATPFSAGDIILPQGFRAANFYVVKAAANGTSATDTWSVNATTLLTTSKTVNSINRGFAGEWKGFQATAAYTTAVASGSGVVALPITLTPTGSGTTTAPMDIEIVWCLTPLNL